MFFRAFCQYVLCPALAAPLFGFLSLFPFNLFRKRGKQNLLFQRLVIPCALTVQMYFRLFLRSGRIILPNWNRYEGFYLDSQVIILYYICFALILKTMHPVEYLSFLTIVNLGLFECFSACSYTMSTSWPECWQYGL